MTLKCTQLRIARPTDQLERVINFYKNGLGLKELGHFKDHNGFSGIMLGQPSESYHFEFTEHINGSPCPAPTKDNLLVFYFEDIQQRDLVAQRLFEQGYPEVEPENPYWKLKGITIEDPDQWRVVLISHEWIVTDSILRRGPSVNKQLIPEVEALLEEYLKGISLLKDKYNGLTADELNFKPSILEWSVKEIFIHLGDSEVNAFLRCRTIVAEPNRETFVVDEAKWATELNYQAQDIADYINLFKILRQITYKQLKLIKKEDWHNKSVTHPTLGKITIEAWLKMYINHINQHLNQIDRTLEKFKLSKS